MNHANTFVRRAAAALIVGAAASAIGGIVVQAGVQPTTTVSDERWSYPWTSSALVPISVLWASLHVLVFAGLLGLARSGLAGGTRASRAGAILALTGTALLFIGELASIPIRDELVDDAGATIVGALFGVAILLSALGLLTTGVATLRNGRWPGWGRFSPLIAGIWTLVLVGLGGTKALPVGVAVYGLCLLAVGIAVYAQSAPSPARALPLGSREQAT